jgi:hypothetical protein
MIYTATELKKISKDILKAYEGFSYRGRTFSKKSLTELQLYVENGALPSSFVLGILYKDLGKIVESADESNRDLVFEHYAFVYNYLPGKMWGSSKKVFEFLSKHPSLKA